MSPLHTRPRCGIVSKFDKLVRRGGNLAPIDRVLLVGNAGPVSGCPARASGGGFVRTVVSQGSQTVLLPARVDATTVTDIRRELHAALRLGSGDLVVDLQSVAVLDAAGLGVLVATHRRANNEGRRLVLRSVPPSVGRVFAITRLYRVLNVEHAGTSAGMSAAALPA